MPVACSATALTGSSGAVYFTPAATKACLLAADFSNSDNDINVGTDKDFRVNDVVTFSVKDGATIDGGLVVGTKYRIKTVSDPDGADPGKVEIVTDADGADVTIAGDGADNGGHVEMQNDPSGICEVREWSCDFSASSLDVSTLPCGVGAAAGAAKYLQPKKTQAGPPEITGTMTLYLTTDETSLSQRLMESVMYANQDGAAVKLYLNAVSDGATDPAPDDAKSSFIAGEVVFTDFSTTVNTDDAITAEVSFSMWKVTNWIGLVIS